MRLLFSTDVMNISSIDGRSAENELNATVSLAVAIRSWRLVPGAKRRVMRVLPSSVFSDAMFDTTLSPNAVRRVRSSPAKVN